MLPRQLGHTSSPGFTAGQLPQDSQHSHKPERAGGTRIQLFDLIPFELKINERYPGHTR